MATKHEIKVVIKQLLNPDKKYEEYYRKRAIEIINNELN